MAHRSRSQSGAIAIIAAILLISILVLNGCGSPPSKPSTVQTPKTTSRHLKFDVITDGPVSDPFWSVVKRGMDQAAKDMGVTATYQAQNPFSIPLMTQLIDKATTSGSDGLIVSIPDCAGLTPAIGRAQLVGIPVISINSGSNCASQLGLLNHVGESGYQAGLAGGEKLVAAGAKDVLCISQQGGNTELNDRCRGISDALTKAGEQSQVITVDLSNTAIAQQTIETALMQNTAIDAIMAISPSGATVAMAATQHLNLSNQIKVATFDLSPAVLQDIQQGTLLFAIDQQPYLQGYLPIVLLTLYKTNLNIVTTSLLATGPDFVTKDNVAQVEQLTADGTR